MSEPTFQTETLVTAQVATLDALIEALTALREDARACRVTIALDSSLAVTCLETKKDGQRWLRTVGFRETETGE